MRKFNISEPDGTLKEAIINKIDNLNKPLHSLGRLEELAAQVCLIQQTLQPTLHHPCHLLFGGDHGIEREGVSVSPREVTWQQMVNFTRGGGGVNMFCRQHGFTLYIIDVGVDHDLSRVDGIIDRKVACGTRNFLHEWAMSRDEFDRAIGVGAEMADKCCDDGSDIICIGEMGIANTSPSSVWMSLFLDLPLEQCVGAGAGLMSEGVSHKLSVLSRAIEKFRTTVAQPTPIDVIRWFGGFEMVAAVGAMLRAAERHRVVMVDGFIMTACALAAIQLCPYAKHYMAFGHCGDESGHALMLRLMEAKPLLSLGLRLGEGTGALCAFPIIDSAVRMVNEMNNFEKAQITKYF